MSDTINGCMPGCDYAQWAELGLLHYGEFPGEPEFCNQREDGFDQLAGEWYWFDDDHKTTDGRFVIYSGTFGDDHCPGSVIYAELYDDEDEYRKDAADWEAREEYLETDDDDEE